MVCRFEVVGNEVTRFENGEPAVRITLTGIKCEPFTPLPVKGQKAPAPEIGFRLEFKVNPHSAKSFPLGQQFRMEAMS